MVAKIADAYSCGHCHSAVGWAVDGHGIGHVNVHHDHTCPVLVGTLSSAPDAIRAVSAATEPVVTGKPQTLR